MLKESFIAKTPQEAYKLAIKKYGNINNFKLIAAKQFQQNNEILSEITIEIDEDVFYKANKINYENIHHELKKIESNKRESINLVKNILEEKGLEKEWIDSMLNPFINTKIADDNSLLLSFILEEIEEIINISKIPLEGKYEFFVGATGIGKTTSISKIASWAIKKAIHPKEIAIINLDNFRAAAYEQLGFYAKSLNIDYFCPQKPEDLENIINNLSEKKIVLIDTSGSSPYDIEKLLNIIKYLKKLEDKININLVISASKKYEDIKEIYKYFSFLNINKVILTKIDESKNIGNIISFLIDTKLPLSFISNGQNVPDDLELATKRRILDIFVGEIKE